MERRSLRLFSVDIEMELDDAEVLVVLFDSSIHRQEELDENPTPLQQVRQNRCRFRGHVLDGDVYELLSASQRIERNRHVCHPSFPNVKS